MNATVLGLVAGVCTTGAFLPQIVRVVHLRRAEEISWAYLVVLGFGLACWVAYGVWRSDLSIILANAATLALEGVLAVLKFTTRTSTLPNDPSGTRSL